MPQVSGLGASVTETVPTGRYYAVVDGGGAQAGGSGDPVTDYDDYGSLGAYTLAVSGCTPATISAPGAPTSFGTTLTGTDGLVATWAAPADDGGADLVGYDVSLDGATPERVSPGTTSRSWPAITTGSHSVSVVAVNELGAGPVASASVRRDVPSAPVFEHQYIATDPDDGFQYFWTEWTPPVDDGGTPVLSYRFEYEIRPGVWQLVRELPEAPPGSMFVVHSLGITLGPGAPPAHMRIIAVNEAGDSAPLNVTGQIPGPPRLLGSDSITVTSNKLAGTMLVEWTDPFDGGSPILGTKVAFMDDSDQDIYIEDYPLLDVHDVPAGTNSVLFTDVAAGEHLLAIEPYNQYGPRRSGMWVEMPALLPPDWISEFAPVVVSYDRATSSGTATVSWTAPYTDPDGADPRLRRVGRRRRARARHRHQPHPDRPRARLDPRGVGVGGQRRRSRIPLRTPALHGPRGARSGHRPAGHRRHQRPGQPRGRRQLDRVERQRRTRVDPRVPVAPPARRRGAGAVGQHLRVDPQGRRGSHRAATRCR